MIMKRIFLLALSACALAASTNAYSQEVYPKAGETEAYAAAWAAWQKHDHTIVVRDSGECSRYGKELMEFNHTFYTNLMAACKLQNLRHVSIGSQLLEGDQLAQVNNLYDDEATIRLYLRDSGYNDLSPAQISQIRAYMHKNGIRHVSQIQ
jgi:hypothetical protein